MVWSFLCGFAAPRFVSENVEAICRVLSEPFSI